MITFTWGKLAVKQYYTNIIYGVYENNDNNKDFEKNVFYHFDAVVI